MLGALVLLDAKGSTSRVHLSPHVVTPITAPPLLTPYREPTEYSQRPDLHWSRWLGAHNRETHNNLMLYKTLSAAVYGIDANIIEVEVDVSGIKTNEDHFHTVGLPDAAVRESRDRVAPPCATAVSTFPPPPSPSISRPPTSARRVPDLTCPWPWPWWAPTEA